jgi:hypothetical protein
MPKDFDELPYHDWNQPDFNLYYKDIDEETKQPIKLYVYIKKAELSNKIPSYYRFLYRLRHEVFELNDAVVYHKGDTRNPCPPKKTYMQNGTVFTIRQDVVTFKDIKPFKYVRN